MSTSRENSQNPHDPPGQQDTAGTRLRPPRMYRVLLWNDDVTPIEFATALVHSVFRKTLPEAAALILEVHTEGCSVAGIYTHEIAETYCANASKIAGDAAHPFKVTMEPESDG